MLETMRYRESTLMGLIMFTMYGLRFSASGGSRRVVVEPLGSGGEGVDVALVRDSAIVFTEGSSCCVLHRVLSVHQRQRFVPLVQ